MVYARFLELARALLYIVNHSLTIGKAMFVDDNKPARRPASFDVMDAFIKLDNTRKLALFDRLNDPSPLSFERTVHLFWPQSNRVDAKRLERYMTRRIAANDDAR